MDGPPAQSLTFEGLLPSTMKQPPRDPNTPVIDQPMIGTIFIIIIINYWMKTHSWLIGKVVASAFIMIVGTLYTFLPILEEDGSNLTYASTIAFTTFVMFQVLLIILHY